MRRSLLFSLLLIPIWLAPTQAFALTMLGSDAQGMFDHNTGELSSDSGDGLHAGITIPAPFVGGTIELSLEFDSYGPVIPIFGATFVGTPDGNPDLVVRDAATNVILEADVNFISVAGLFDFGGTTYSGLTLGGIGDAAASSLTVTLDALNLLSGSDGTFKVEFTQMTDDAAGLFQYRPNFDDPTPFDQDIFGGVNIVLDVSSPEPSTGLLLASSLLALSAWRKRRA